MLLVKVPFPEASVVLSLIIVGSGEVDQHTPLAMISEPPLPVILPPETAEVYVIELELISAVVRMGTASDSVVNVRISP